MLAGLGVQTLVTRMAEPRSFRRFATRTAAVLVLIVLGLNLLGLARWPSAPSRRVEAARRVLDDDCFRATLGGLAALLVLGCASSSPRFPRLAGGLIGLLALCELGWHGNSLLQVAPEEQFLAASPVSDALRRLETDAGTLGHVRIKTRDTFYGDLPAVWNGFEKTNVNDLFQIDHAAQLYEQLYPVAVHRRRNRDDPMNAAVEDFNRQVRQSVFDRMSVSHVVSNRFESDPGWPVAAKGLWNGGQFVIQRNPGRLPRAYVVACRELMRRASRLIPVYSGMSIPARRCSWKSIRCGIFLPAGGSRSHRLSGPAKIQTTSCCA